MGVFLLAHVGIGGVRDTLAYDLGVVPGVLDVCRQHDHRVESGAYAGELDDHQQLAEGVTYLASCFAADVHDVVLSCMRACRPPRRHLRGTGL